MDILLIIIALVCILLGLLGCVLPLLPGPPLAYVGMLLLHFTADVEFTTTQLLVWLIITVATQLLDYIVPMLGSRYTGGSKWGANGCLVGTLVGLFFMPWGIVIGPFVGAVAGELLGGSDTAAALKSGFGSLMGFLLGTVVKCAVCGYFLWQFIAAL